MKYLDLREKLRNQVVFSVRDLLILDSNFDRRRLYEWQKKGYIRKVIKGCYIFSDSNIDEYILFHTANKIYPPSYISLESALSYYNIIPEIIPVITSVTTRKTNKFETEISSFYYQSIKENLFIGYTLLNVNNLVIKIATIEKAIIDYFYLHKEIRTAQIFKDLRWDMDIVMKELNRRKFMNLINLFNDNSLKRRISLCMNI